jgi:DNA-3-methyladenine glycosylase
MTIHIRHEHMLARNFFDEATEDVAQHLLGTYVVRTLDSQLLIGKIVETEAYLPVNDPAAHAHNGETLRTKILFGEPGRSYVYRIHRSHCLNVVTERIGTPGCVLIRAVEPIAGIPLMHDVRKTATLRDLTNGPGKVCEAFQISRALNGVDLTSPDSVLTLVRGDHDRASLSIEVSTRVGISKATHLPLRFYLKGNAFVSRPARRTV